MNSLSGLICVLGMLTAGGLLLVSNFVHLWLPLDILRHFTVHLIIIAVACMVGLLMPFARLTTAVTFILVGFLLIGSYAHYIGTPAHASASLRSEERALRVMTFNTRLGNNDIGAIVAEIRRLQPELIMLVEFGANKRQIAEVLKGEFPYFTGCDGKCQFGVLSRLPIVFVEEKQDWEGPMLIRVALGSEFSQTTVIGVHLRRPPDIIGQFRQIQALGDYLTAIDGRLLLMGDFNSTPFSELFDELGKRTDVKRLTAIPSWPSYFKLPQLAIDHVFASPEIRLLKDAQIGHSAGSDHYPVVLTLGVPLR